SRPPSRALAPARSRGPPPRRTSASRARPRAPPAPDSGSTSSCTPPPASAPSGATPQASARSCPGPSAGSCPCPAASGRPSTCTSLRACSRARPYPIAGLSRRRGCSRPRALADFSRFVLALQPLATALHGRDELRQVDLERVQDLIRGVLRAKADLALPRAGILDDVLGGALGLLGDLLLADQPVLTLACLLEDP